MKAPARIPFAKFCAVTAALACAGGGVFAGQSVTASAATPPVALDHYLCTGDFGHAACDPVTVGLPNGTTVGVNDPNGRLVCDRVRHETDATATVHVVNEFSPTGPAGATPVDLVRHRLRSTCSVASMQPLFHSHAQGTATPLTQYTCASVRYPSPASTQFQSPAALTIGNRMSVRLTRPSRLCVPTGAVPAVSGPSEMLCFHVSVAETTRRHGIVWNPAPWLRLCVPSSEGTAPVSVNSSTTTSSSSTSTSTTGSTTTTTIRPTTTTASTTTTTTRPTTTTASTTTTTTTTIPPSTTTTSASLPCPGVIINGVCVIPL